MRQRHVVQGSGQRAFSESELSLLIPPAAGKWSSAKHSKPCDYSLCMSASATGTSTRAFLDFVWIIEMEQTQCVRIKEMIVHFL